MNASGLIVEYNPFHYGHVYHIQEAKKLSQADVMIAVMSGSFLQRGEPAFMDKFHRTKAALHTGVDIVIELPYAYSVQHSDLFASGAVNLLYALGVSSICFGSESGEIKPFIKRYHHLKKHETLYQSELKNYLNKGLSYPDANMKSLQSLGIDSFSMDLAQPNNILGTSYVKAILDYELAIEPFTIQRIKNNYHDTDITNKIASATSIRKEIFKNNQQLTEKTKDALPDTSLDQINAYLRQTNTLHNWEAYFPYLHYRVQTMSAAQLREIHGVDEGIEYRILKTAKTAANMRNWMEKMKTKRYTWARIQRLFVHILTNTRKDQIEQILSTKEHIPYIRLLGMTENGRNYLHEIKKDLVAPIVTSLKRDLSPMLELDERASLVYYSILPASQRIAAFKQELQGPIRI